MLAPNLVTITFQYCPPQKSVHAELLGMGVCPDCKKSRKVVRDFMGRFKSVSDCAFCEKANDEEKRKDISIWVLCGAAGSGKTSLFNALTGVEAPTGDGSETKSLNSQTIAYCLVSLCHAT